jgi:hypothetical protein
LFTNFQVPVLLIANITAISLFWPDTVFGVCVIVEETRAALVEAEAGATLLDRRLAHPPPRAVCEDGR